MARRGRKGKGRRKNRAIPLLALAPAWPVFAQVINDVRGHEKLENIPKKMINEAVGYNMFTNTWNEGIIKRQIGLTIGGMVGHKIANKYVNKHLRKLTFGYWEL